MSTCTSFWLGNWELWIKNRQTISGGVKHCTWLSMPDNWSVIILTLTTTNMDGERLHKTAEVLPLSSPLSPQTLIFSTFLIALLLLAGIFNFTHSSNTSWRTTVTIYRNKRRLASKGNSFLLVGPSDGGKTAILSQVSFGLCHNFMLFKVK